MMQLTRFLTKLLRQVVEDFSGLFVLLKNMKNASLKDSFSTHLDLPSSDSYQVSLIKCLLNVVLLHFLSGQRPLNRAKAVVLL